MRFLWEIDAFSLCACIIKHVIRNRHVRKNVLFMLSIVCIKNKFNIIKTRMYVLITITSLRNDIANVLCTSPRI